MTIHIHHYGSRRHRIQKTQAQSFVTSRRMRLQPYLANFAPEAIMQNSYSVCFYGIYFGEKVNKGPKLWARGEGWITSRTARTDRKIV
jgi:hypothetical protein